MGKFEYLDSPGISRHIPVLLSEVVHGLNIHPGGQYLDATGGGGGHSLAILQTCGPDGRVLVLDRDPEAVIRLTEYLDEFKSRVTIVHTSYVHLFEIAADNNFLPLDGVLFDLGFSSWQIDNPNRGFSHHLNGPLDMRYDTSSTDITAEELVNTMSTRELADVIWRYGEEKQSRRIANAIVQQRPIKSSLQLAQIIADAKTSEKKARLHPATRTFQALRIAVNDELSLLEKTLPQAIKALKTSRRIAVISFHSLEDRIVKQFFKRESKDCICPPSAPVCTCNHQRSLRIVSRKVITPSEVEIQMNPRSRSAKLRIAEKVV
jgi:16S rRNA (cytosine1402-N4)-methyltransferase